MSAPAAPPRRWREVAWLLLPLVLALAPYVVLRGGFLHPEAKSFLVNYTDDRGFLAKVFDPQKNDWGLYQARELSYAIDWLDAHGIDLAIRLGFPVFFPLSHALGVLAIALLCWRRRRTNPHDPGALTTSLLLAIFLADPVVFLSAGCYLRSAKIAVAATLLAFLHFLARVLAPAGATPGEPGSPPRAPSRTLLAAFGLATLLSLLDRQGFFFALLGATLLALARAWPDATGERRRAIDPALLGCAGAIALATAYDLWIAPALVRWANGYSPDFRYQSFPALEVLWHPSRLAEAAGFLAEQVGFLVGNAGALAGAVVALAGLAAVATSEATSQARARAREGTRTLGAGAALVLGATVALALVVMLALMILRHPPLVWPDLRRAYYGLPLAALFLFGATLAVERGRELLGSRARLLDAALGLVLVASLVALPGHRRIVYGEHAADAQRVSDELRRILAAPPIDPAPPWASPETRALLERYARLLGRRR